MAKADIWPTINAERQALADDLQSLSDDQWATASLAGDWSVRDVLAHMTATGSMNPPQFFGKLIGSGFSFEKVQAKGIAAYRGGSPADTLAAFRAIVNTSTHPPGPPDTWMGEVIVHSQDIRRPLGITHEYPTAALIRTADFYKGSNLLIGAKKRIDGVTLTATDADWRHGSGPETAGPLAALVMAMTGRQAVLGELTGEGVATLRSRA